VLTGCRVLMCSSQNHCGLRLLMCTRFKDGMLAYTIARKLALAVDRYASAQCMRAPNTASDCIHYVKGPPERCSCCLDRVIVTPMALVLSPCHTHGGGPPLFSHDTYLFVQIGAFTGSRRCRLHGGTTGLQGLAGFSFD